MKVSLNLLKEFARLDDPPKSIFETIAERLGEVEAVEELALKYKNVVVGKVISSVPHPNADKLSLNKVDIGRRKVQVLAGDKTLEANDLVAYIPPGSVVPSTVGKNELVIEVRTIRGQDSHGMLASEKELDFSSAHAGVLKLDKPAKPGTSLTELYKLDDYIIDVETKVLTHRPDMFGHLGFARELSAALGKPFKSPEWYLNKKPAWPKPHKQLALSVDNRLKSLVPRITLASYEGVQIKPSPVQIQSWLMRLGVRPTNNVVDLTNYMMLISAQPLHAFDYDKVSAGKDKVKITVRHARQGESLRLLDGKVANLHAGAIIIDGNGQAVGLGGVMGGADTEVDDDTKRVIIEAANFDMYSIRNTTMHQGIASEAATRFARGQDPTPIAAVQAMAAKLMGEWAQGRPASPLIDDYPKPRVQAPIKADSGSINRLLGVAETAGDMAKTLNSAELNTKVDGNKLVVKPPSWRPDVNIEADIAEEVGRLKGYSRIKPRVPKRDLNPAEPTDSAKLEARLRRLLSAAGANELLTYSGVPEQLLKLAGQEPKRAYRIRNALSPDFELMRLSLTPSLLNTVYPNLRRGFDEFALFEIGVAHNNLLIEDKLPQEQPSVAFVYAASTKARQPNQGAAYYLAGKYLSYVLNSLELKCKLSSSSPADDPWLAQMMEPFDRNRRAFIQVNNQIVGVVGEMESSTSKSLRLPKSTAGFEIHLERLLKAEPGKLAYASLSRYPAVYVDLTLRSREDVSYAKLFEAIDSISVKEADINCRPLEIFAPDKSHKHTSFRLEFVSHERTLTQNEVNKWLAMIVKKVRAKTGASQV